MHSLLRSFKYFIPAVFVAVGTWKYRRDEDERIALFWKEEVAYLEAQNRM